MFSKFFCEWKKSNISTNIVNKTNWYYSYHTIHKTRDVSRISKRTLSTTLRSSHTPYYYAHTYRHHHHNKICIRDSLFTPSIYTFLACHICLNAHLCTFSIRSAMFCSVCCPLSAHYVSRRSQSKPRRSLS